MAKKKSSKKTNKKSSKKSSKKSVSNNKIEEIDFGYLATWSTKIGISAEELKAKVVKIANELTEKHKDWNIRKIYGTARRRIYSNFKAEFRSSAVPWLLYPLYKQEPNDYGYKHYKANLDAYNKNPREALKNKLVEVRKIGRNEEIIPIEERPKTRAGKERKSFGKPLPEHDWIMTIGGLGIPEAAANEEKWEMIRPFELTVSGVYADPMPKFDKRKNKEIPNRLYLGDAFNKATWYKVKATNQTEKDNEETYVLNASSVTKFMEYEGLEMDIEQIKEFYADFYVELGELLEYHEGYASQNKDGTYEFNTRIVVTEGSVVDITISDDESKNSSIAIDDESIGFGDDDDEIPDSVMCWIDYNKPITFGKESRIMIFGTTSRGLKKDPVTKEKTDEWNNVSINLYDYLVLDLVEPDVVDEKGGDDEENEEYEAEETVDEEEPEVEYDEETEDESDDKW